MAKQTLTMVAPRAKVLTKSTFNNYDACINPYVGCEFGCSYCYVRFFIKDKVKPWGEFLRVREHISEVLPKELQKGILRFTNGREPIVNDDGTVALNEKNRPATKPKHITLAISDARLVIGTMTDPYQPQELKHRITRTVLQILTRSSVPKFKKVGIFTRSPLVLRDLELIRQLPKARVHFTITPYPHEVMRAIEPFSPTTERRWDTIKKLKEAGLRVHVNVAPVMPLLSENLIEEWAERLAVLGIDEYFVDPMQPYKESFVAFKEGCNKVNGLKWSAIEMIMCDRNRYLDWKFDFFQQWNAARKKYEHLAPHQLPIWCDHEHKVWVDMRTGQQMSHRFYGDDI